MTPKAFRLAVGDIALVARSDGGGHFHAVVFDITASTVRFEPCDPAIADRAAPRSAIVGAWKRQTAARRSQSPADYGVQLTIPLP